MDKVDATTFRLGLYSLPDDITIIDRLYGMSYKDLPDFPYDNAHVFLMGSCQLFALALHKKFGYRIYVIMQDKPLHWFCRFCYEGRYIYVDVRGATSDFEEFKAGIVEWKNAPYCICSSNINEDEELNEEWAEEGLLFANKIIEQFPEYYSI